MGRKFLATSRGPRKNEGGGAKLGGQVEVRGSLSFSVHRGGRNFFMEVIKFIEVTGLNTTLGCLVVPIQL